MNRSLVIVATYNECDNISPLYEMLTTVGDTFDILFVDDNSPDETGALADALARRDPRVHVIHRTRKEGIGPAIVEGFHWAIQHGYANILNMDGDLSHNPFEALRLFSGLKEADMIIGSRYLGGTRTGDWPIRRLLLSRCAGSIARLATRIPFTDPTSGFRCFKATALKRLLNSDFVAKGFSFHIECAHRAWVCGLSVKEVPIHFRCRLHGQTKLTLELITEALLLLIRIAAKRTSLQKRLA